MTSPNDNKTTTPPRTPFCARRTAAFVCLIVSGLLGCVHAFAAEPSSGQVKAQPAAPSARTQSPTAIAVAKLEKEIRDGIAQRQLQPVLDAYLASLNKRLDDSQGEKSWGDKTGNCRLDWIDHMLRNPIESIGEAEAFTRTLHEAIVNDVSLKVAIKMCADKLDIKKPIGAGSGQGVGVDRVAGALKSAVEATVAAMAPLSDEERAVLRESAYEATTGRVRIGARVPNSKTARPVFDLIEKLDHSQYVLAGQTLLSLSDETTVKALLDTSRNQTAQVQGVEGDIQKEIRTDAGRIIIGGQGNNTYNLEALSDVVMILDPDGNDTYIEGTLSQKRPVLLIVDLAGDDNYKGEKPGIQGGAILGASVLVDRAGDDRYNAGDVAQGACVAGFGLLIDDGGHDTYKAVRRVQGSALGGIAVLIDRDGNDVYRGALFAQGVGGPLGLGVLDDIKGDDTYFAGGLYLDGYDDSPGYDGFSQGCGYGPRGVANGGIGVLLDGSGDDTYECDYFSHASGYWFAAGLARDFDGNDKRLGATREAFDGTERKEKRFLRYGISFGCHYAIGFLFDDRGDDEYAGSVSGHGFAWDFSIGVVCDFDGNDTYKAGGNKQGVASQAGFGVLLDVAGDDSYVGSGPCQGFSNPKIEYHKELTLGGNFSFLVDWQGKDSYSSGAENNAITERGSAGGFLIDRESQPE